MRLHIVIAIVVALACFGCALAAVSDGQQGDAREASVSDRVCEVTVVVDGKTTLTPTSAATVGKLLGLLKITLKPLDRTDPAPGQAITDGMEVLITRVTCREVTEDSMVPSKTVVLAEPDMPAGFTKILSHGSNGLARRVWRVWEKDGEETSRGLLSEEVLARKSDTVVLRGTYGAPDRGGSWHRPLVMTATAYDPGPRSCGRYADGYTATGVKAEKGVVAVDDRIIRMGTRLYIPGYGFAVAADRGSAIKGMRIDLCYPTYREAIQFGRRKVKVYLLD